MGGAAAEAAQGGVLQQVRLDLLVLRKGAIKWTEGDYCLWTMAYR